MGKIIINRTVKYVESVVLEVENATTKKDFMEAIMQNNNHKTFPLTIKEPDVLYTYDFASISDSDIIN